MASKVTNLRIPVTVTTEGVDKGLAATERKIRNSAAKMKRLGTTAQAPTAGGLGGALGPSKGTAFLGGIGKLGPLSGLLGGMGAGGLAAAAPIAAISMAIQSVERLAQMTAGASEAMENFRRTGEQTFAANSVILSELARMEKGAQAAAKTMGFFEAATFAGARPGEKGMGEFWSEQLARSGAGLGAVLSGKSFEEGKLLSELVNASEPRAKEIQAELRRAEASRFDKGLFEGMASGESLIWSMEKLAQSFFRMWDG